MSCDKHLQAQLNQKDEYINRLENDLFKECKHSQSITKTLEIRTKKLDVAVGLLQSIYTVILLEQGQSNHPVNRLSKQIQELLESGGDW